MHEMISMIWFIYEICYATIIHDHCISYVTCDMWHVTCDIM